MLLGRQATRRSVAGAAGRKRHRNGREYLLFLAFIAPNFALLCVFTYWPMISQFYISFTDWNFLSPKTFVGLENYLTLFASEEFRGVLLNTVYFMGSVLVGSVVLGMALGLLLNQKLKGRNLVRSIVFAPYVVSGAAIGLVWSYIFDPSYGLLHALLKPLGIASPDWLGSTSWAMPALIIVYLWKSLGFSAVIYLAALQNISQDLYDAAKVDGASSWQTFRKVTLPQLSPATFFVVVITMVQAFSYNAFDIISVMTNGGPVNATTTLIWYIYEEGFRAFHVGLAAAASTILFLILIVITAVQTFFTQRRVHYQ